MNFYSGLYKSSDDKMIAGVCAGLAHKMNLSKAGLRIIFILLAMSTGTTLIIYIALWLLLKSAPTRDR